MGYITEVRQLRNSIGTVAILSLMAVSMVGCTQKPEVSASAQVIGTEFHGIKMGVPIEESMKECEKAKKGTFVSGYKGDMKAMCFEMASKDNSPFGLVLPGKYGEVHQGMWIVGDRKAEYAQLSYEDAGGSGAVDLVELNTGAERATHILEELKDKYGKPTCSVHRGRTRIGIPIESQDCSWKTTWGQVQWWNSNEDNINEMKVMAQSNNWLKLNKEWREKHKKDNEF